MIGWHGDRIRLVPLDEKKHLQNCYDWINDPQVTQFLLAGDIPMTMLAERDWFEKVSKSEGTEIGFAIETLDGVHIGNSGIHMINHRHGFGTSGSLIGRVDLWGQGLGTEAAIVRARYAFEVLGLRMLYSSSLEGNVRSARMQAKVGYEVYGTAPKKWWKRGCFRDETLTVLTRDRFLELHPVIGD